MLGFVSLASPVRHYIRGMSKNLPRKHRDLFSALHGEGWSHTEREPEWRLDLDMARGLASVPARLNLWIKECAK
jgi:hypothetical protein